MQFVFSLLTPRSGGRTWGAALTLGFFVCEEQEERAARSRVQRCQQCAEPSLAGAGHWKCSWLVFPSVERLFIKINNGMLIWERALNQLFPCSYRCLSFQAMYSAKHTARVAEIATEQPFPLITRLPKHHLFPESEENTQWKPDGSTLKIAVYLLSKPRVAH